MTRASHLLILGGTTEAAALARAVAGQGIRATVSLAGRVARPAALPLPVRIGGFGGAEGLVAHLERQGITHLVDATHPFAAQMSRNAVTAAARTGVPLVALTRPPWRPGPGDRWRRVPDMAGAVAALAGPARRVFLAVGRMHLAEFKAQEQHRYLLRLVDPPAGPLPLREAHVEVARGPFTEAEDRALLSRHGIALVVSKNAGGAGARAKIDAARALGLEVVMIDRPALPPRAELHGWRMCWTGFIPPTGACRRSGRRRGWREEPSSTTVRMSAISGRASGRGTVRISSASVVTARAKIIGRASPQASRSTSSARAKPSGRDFERGL